MKFFIQQHITWQDGSKSVKIFDANVDKSITVAQVKELARPNYSLKADEVLTESVFVNEAAQKGDSQKITNSRIEYRAEIGKKLNSNE